MKVLKKTKRAKTYWASNGRFQNLLEKVMRCDGNYPEPLRSATALYYDHNNNGNCNHFFNDLEVVKDAKISKSGKFKHAMERIGDCLKKRQMWDEGDNTRVCPCCGREEECEAPDLDEYDTDFETMMDFVIPHTADKVLK